LYLKRVLATKPDGKSYAYLKLVQAYRSGGRARERVILNLGREDELKASGQLEGLAAAFARRDPPMLGVRREVGPLLLVRHFLDRLGLAGIVERHLPTRGRAQLTNAEVVSALIANRLAAPSPLYDIAGWASSAAIHELFGIPAMLLNDDRLGRALEAFAPRAEQIRSDVAMAAIDRFGVDAGRLHLDLTSLRVTGAYENSSLVAKGWDHQRQTVRQVKVLQATNPLGVPLYSRPQPGNQAELTAIAAGLQRLTEVMPPGLVVCADSSFGHLRHLCAADRAQVGFVVPLRDVSNFRNLYAQQVGQEALQPLDYVPWRERDLPTERRTQYRGCLRQLPVVDPATGSDHLFKVAFIWSSQEEATVRAARERALDKAEQELLRVQRGLGSYYRSRAQVQERVAVILSGKARGLIQAEVGGADPRPTLDFRPDPQAIADQAASDGIYALASNLPEVSAGDLLRIYKEQSLVELRHRDLKQTLRVRPIFLHNDDRIQALVSVVGLALMVFGLIELELRQAVGGDAELAGLLPEGRSARPTVRNVLGAFQGLGLTYTAAGIRLDRLTSPQRRILAALDVAIPWPEDAAA
jgi:transposase